MNLFLLRHVESISNEKNSADSRKDLDLSEKGKKDAEDLVSTLSQNKYDIFIVNSLKRTIKTIEPFLKTLPNPTIVSSDLTLERDLGVFTGTPMGTFQNYCKEKGEHPVYCKPGKGESIAEVYERAKDFLKGLKNNYDDKTILICGHKIFLLCLEVAIKEENIENFYSLKPLDNGEIREFKL